MKVLVYGGSFDPPHRGHAALLAAAARRVRPDRIVVVPAGRARLKPAAPAAPPAERAALARLGLVDALPARWRSRARLDLSELDAPGTPTVATLARLERLHPGAELHFLCGLDAALSFPRWKSPERLKALAVWWCGGRAGSAGTPPPHFRRVPGRFPDLSSTELRSALALGHDCSDALLPAVAARIRARGLYGGAVLARLGRALHPSRLEHTLHVAELAEALARRHGADPERARLAGLLHDLGRGLKAWQMPAYARRRRLKVPLLAELARREPMLIHAWISEDLARRELGVRDPAVLSAIRKHTLAARSMSRLDRVVYVADSCSRDRGPEARELRALAFSDLDAAFVSAMRRKIEHALERGRWLHPLTLASWNSLVAR